MNSLLELNLPKYLISLPVFCGVSFARSLVICVVCSPFHFCHSVVYTSLIYEFGLPLSYLRPLRLNFWIQILWKNCIFWICYLIDPILYISQCIKYKYMGENRWILNITSNSQLTLHCKIVFHRSMEMHLTPSMISQMHRAKSTMAKV